MIYSSVFIIGTAIIMWVLFGYSLAFGQDHFGIIGGFNLLGLNGAGSQAGPYSATIPSLVFTIFQMMFAIITLL